MEQLSLTILELKQLFGWLYRINIIRCQFEEVDVEPFILFYALVSNSQKEDGIVTLTIHPDFLFVTFEKSQGVWMAHKKSKLHIIGHSIDISGTHEEFHNEMELILREKHCADSLLLETNTFAEIIANNMFTTCSPDLLYTTYLINKLLTGLEEKTICLGDIISYNSLKHPQELCIITLNRNGDYRMQPLEYIPFWKNLPIGFLLFYHRGFFDNAQIEIDEYIDIGIDVKDKMMVSFNIWREELIQDFPQSKNVELLEILN